MSSIFNILKKKDEEIFSVNDWIPIKEIKSDTVYLRDGTALKILSVDPINLKLKSLSEQEIILENYNKFLKLCNFDMQIIVQTEKADVEGHIAKITNNSDKQISKLTNEYVELIRDIVVNRGSSSKRFYIVLKVTNNITQNVNSIFEGLSKCGNDVRECTSDELRNIFKVYLNKRLINIGG